MRLNSNLEMLIFVILFALIVIFIRVFFVGTWDRERIIEDAKKRGWRIKSINWEPFGPSWYGERNDRIYSVDLINDNGKHEIKYCKTSISSVYWK